MTANYVIGLLGLALFGRTIQFVLSRRKKSSEDSNSERDVMPLNEVLFFPDSRLPCPDLVRKLTSSTLGASISSCGKMSCRRLHNRPSEPSSMIRFLEHLSKAKHTVDLCIYIFTQAQLADVLCDLKRKSQVNIRVITDCTEDDGTASQIKRLRGHNILVKSNKRGTGALMHHKFVIIDNAILLSGSFNWTNKAVVSNYEAVLVTSEPSLVQPFCEKFNQMWDDFGMHPVC